MEFLSVRELTTSPKEVWAKLAKEGELAITNNGKPTAIMFSVVNNDFSEILKLLHQVKSAMLLKNIWQEADERRALSEAEIDSEIKAARAELNKQRKKFNNASRCF